MTEQSFQTSLIYKDIIFALLFQMLFLLFPHIPRASNYHLLINKLSSKYYIYCEITRFKDATLPPFESTFRVMCVAVYGVASE